MSSRLPRIVYPIQFSVSISNATLVRIAVAQQMSMSDERTSPRFRSSIVVYQFFVSGRISEHISLVNTHFFFSSNQDLLLTFPQAKV